MFFFRISFTGLLLFITYGGMAQLALEGVSVSVGERNTSIYSIVFSPDGNKIVFAAGNGLVKCWNLRNNFISVLPHPATVNDAVFSGDGNSIMTGSTDNIVRCWTINGELKFQFQAHTEARSDFTELRKAWGISDISLTPQNYLLTSGHDKYARLWKTDGSGSLWKEYPLLGKTEGYIESVYSADSVLLTGGDTGNAILFQNGKYISYAYKNISSVAISPDGNYRAAASLLEVDITSYDFSNPGKQAKGSTGIVRIWDRAGNIIASIDIVRPTKIIFSRDNKKILIGNDKGEISLWTMNGEKIAEFKSHTAEITGLSFHPDDYRFISASKDGTIKLWNIGQGLVATLFPDSDDNENFIIVSQNGFYYSTTREVKGLSYVIDQKSYSFDQFDLYYNRPDIVLPAMGFADESVISLQQKLREKRMEVLGLPSDVWQINSHIPELQVEWFNNKPATFVTSSPMMEIKIKASSVSVPLQTVHVRVNGVPAFGKNGIPVSEMQILKVIPVTLSTGKNILSVSVVNKLGLESNLEERTVFYNSPDSKPSLYFVGIASGKFKSSNEEYQLSSAKDISVFEASLKKLEGKAYSRVVSLSLYDEEVSIDKLRELRKKLLGTSPDDVVILYFVGHGVLDKEDNYYLSAYSMDFNNPAEGGIPYAMLDQLLDSIPSRNKLIMLNACNSGEFNRQQVIFNAMSQQFYDLRKNSGAYVISSSAGDKPSYFPENSNSLFTEALIKIITTRQGVKVSDLKSAIQQYIDKSLQTPTIRQYNNKNDFVLW